jgi:hypothetical protein
MGRVALFAVLLGVAIWSGAPAAAADWSLRAGTRFQHVGEYTIRAANTRFADAIAGWGNAGSCKVAGSDDHAVATWPERGIWVDLWTYGGLPVGENGCTSPDLISVSEIRLTDRRWSTSFGLHVGDATTKLRKLYPKAAYQDRRTGARRSEYWLVTRHSACIGVCTPYQDKHGVEVPRLTAQVRGGRVIAFWVPVFGQGE